MIYYEIAEVAQNIMSNNKENFLHSQYAFNMWLIIHKEYVKIKNRLIAFSNYFSCQMNNIMYRQLIYFGS